MHSLLLMRKSARLGYASSAVLALGQQVPHLNSNEHSRLAFLLERQVVGRFVELVRNRMQAKSKIDPSLGLSSPEVVLVVLLRALAAMSSAMDVDVAADAARTPLLPTSQRLFVALASGSADEVLRLKETGEDDCGCTGLLACLLCVERAERARVVATHSHHHSRTHSHTLTHGHHRRHCRTTHTRTHNEPHMCATVYNSLGGALSLTPLPPLPCLSVCGCILINTSTTHCALVQPPWPFAQSLIDIIVATSTPYYHSNVSPFLSSNARCPCDVVLAHVSDVHDAWVHE
jgi:hypothetical protein